MYILIKSAFENRKMIPILKYTDENVSDEFSKAVFSTTLITRNVEEEFINNFKKPVETTTKQKTTFQVFSRVYKSFNTDPDLQVSFNFLIQLNRIISELQHPGFMGSSNLASKTSSFTSRAVGLAGYTAVNATGLIKSPVNFIISDTKLQYEELLREYTLMTGNFLMLTSRFILDKTKLKNDETELVNNQLTEKLKSIEDAINTVTNDIGDGAEIVNQAAESMVKEYRSVGEVPVGANSQVDSQENLPENPPENPQGGRSLSKKKYNYSQKRKTKRNKRKRRAL